MVNGYWEQHVLTQLEQFLELKLHLFQHFHVRPALETSSRNASSAARGTLYVATQYLAHTVSDVTTLNDRQRYMRKQQWQLMLGLCSTKSTKVHMAR